MIWLGLLGLLGLLIYWEFVLAEGVHLGPRVVVWLYDLTAPAYERLKKFNPEDEDRLLGLPLAAALAEMDTPLVLDLATGTGRAARALLRQPAFDGKIVGLDLSARMLTYGRRACPAWPERLFWVRSPAAPLPFASAFFDAVICLEALEFLPDDEYALAECVRVLRPGGILLISHRIGWRAWLMPGHVRTAAGVHRQLQRLGLDSIRRRQWQVEYDLVWARKPRSTVDLSDSGRQGYNGS